MAANQDPDHTPGTRVYDGEKGPSASMVVVEHRDETCAEWAVPGTGRTVADFNDTYPDDAEVCTAVFASNLYETIPNWESKHGEELAAAIQDADIKTYTYPKPRLRTFRDDDSTLVQEEITTYFELLCYQHARLIQLAAGINDSGFLWTKYEQLVDGEIEVASITKENQYQLQEDFGVCTYCGKDAETQYDHIIPISEGGPADISNQVPACKSCNLGKQAADPIDWHQERGEPVPRIVWGKYLKLYRDRLEAAGRLHDHIPETERERWDGIELTRNIKKRIKTSHLKRDEAGRTCSQNDGTDNSDGGEEGEIAGQSTLDQYQ